MAITTNGGAGVTADAVATLSNKTLEAPVINNATFTGAQAGLALKFNQSIVFEGTTDDAYETTLTVGDPTADRTITFPDATTTVVGTDTVQTLTNKTIGVSQLSGAVALTNGGTGATSAPAAMAALMGYTSTATAAGTTTLTASSSYYQQFTGTTTQTVQLPVVSTLTTGWTYHVVNNSTGLLTVTSSGGNTVITVPAGTTAMVTCISTSGTTAASWESGLTDFSTYTGSGDNVLATAPTVSNLTLTGTLTAASSAGTSGYVLTSTGTGVQWAAASSGGVSANDQAFAFAVQVFA